MCLTPALGMCKSIACVLRQHELSQPVTHALQRLQE